MDEIDKIQTQLAGLAQAQSSLLNEKPPDTQGFQQLASRISALQFRLVALAGRPQIPALSAAEVATLQSAVRTLAAAVTASAGAMQILQAATTLANS